MDVGKLLKNVHSLNEYISTTQDASEKCKSSKIQMNMSTVLALKKIRSLEIEVCTFTLIIKSYVFNIKLILIICIK